MDRFPSGFAVVDVEATGLRWRADRIIEVAVVRLDAEGAVVSEFSTLVDPERNPGATHIHGLSVEDLVDNGCKLRGHVDFIGSQG